MQSSQPEFFISPLIKYTRPSRFDIAPYKTPWIFTEDNYKEIYIQQSEDIEHPAWERLGIGIEKEWIQER